MFKNALVSVSDKTGLIDFIKPYATQGMRVVSTGGTLRYLRERGIDAVEVSEQTGFPEVMDGRVKTLHPRIHMALLARTGHSGDMALLDAEGLEPFDLVIVNLYPFEEARQRRLPESELIEFIDVGGPTLLRAAAKSFERLTVLCEPEDYAWVAAKARLDLTDRKRLAGRVYRHTSRYDDLIAKTLLDSWDAPLTLVGRPVAELRYGENPQQKAWWYRRPESPSGLHEAKILHGKALSYNNILDLDAAVGAVTEFSEPAAVAVKHNNPCGLGTHMTISGALTRAIQADPVSVFGGIIALNRRVDAVSAEEMAKLFLECIIAPAYAPEALERLKKKKDLRLLEWPGLSERDDGFQFRTVNGGFLVQTPDRTSDGYADWKVLGEDPSDEIRRDLVLAWKACARLKSNAIALASGGRTVGLGMGQVNRVDAVEQAIERMLRHHAGVRNVVLASDAFFPFPDSVERAAKAGIRWIIQPGGSIRDQEVIKRAEELNVTMILTGVRHFRH